MSADQPYLAEGRCDADGTLISASEPLAGLQLRCGGTIPGTIAIPPLLDLVRKAQSYRIKLARLVRAADGQEHTTAWVEVSPEHDGDGQWHIGVRTWSQTPLPPENPEEVVRHQIEIDRVLAEFTARLDPAQRVQTADSTAADLDALASAMREGAGQPWTDFVTIEGSSHRQPVHWRLLDGATVRVSGSHRVWRAALIPLTGAGEVANGFDLLLTSDEPLAVPAAPPASSAMAKMPNNMPGLVGRDVAPVLRQPIARIIANAETIRTRMAGPLAEEYSQYAADIAAAGQHLLALVDDLTDLEVVEAEQFNTAPDRIDLADVARRAAGILAVRAQERGITIDAPREGETLPAIAEFRRVLQVLLNLVGNAIRYSPDNSQVWIRLEDDGPRARVIVADQGPGLSAEQQARVFEKFERLGRSDEGGSGLGLYISRRLARAMGGELTIDSSPGQGARFILAVPADLLAAKPHTAG